METIKVMEAATLICLRRRANAWEVLLGQGEVKNWLRSSETATRVMRYPGEWKFPGGNVDAQDASLEAAALRELQEEFLGLPGAAVAGARVYFLSEKLTRPIQRRRHRMFNFVAFEDENQSWLNDEALQHVNATLQRKRDAFFAQYLADGSFWTMTEQQKMQVSPEIRCVQWFPIQDAMHMMLMSLLDPYRSPVNAWQQQEFETYGVSRRDPMFITLQVLKEIADVESLDKLRDRVRNKRPIPASSL